MADKISLNRHNNDDEFEPSDSEDEYSEEEKEILQEVRKGNKRQQDEQQEVLAFSDSDEDEDDVNELMGDSDIEGAADNDDDIPDAMDWGKNKRSYYNTDFVDPDFDTYTAEQEELALAEEEEAKAIQQRLVKQMNEQDFELNDVLPSIAKVVASDEENDAEALAAHKSEIQKSKADFAGLTNRERKQLFHKDSPEFQGLITDFELYYNDVQELIQPVLAYVKENKTPFIPAFEFAELYQNLALTYCSNISFYLLLKAERVAVKQHPLTKRLVQIKQLLMQLQSRYEEIIKPQLEALLERIVDGDRFEVLEVLPKKRQLDIMKAYAEPSKKAKLEADADANAALASDGEDLEEDEDDDEGEAAAAAEGAEEIARRGITYQIAKNKGLTPYRKKELRNPRVKHRGKYRKALIRRKGAVRTVRKETKRYGGEISGIKATVSKSIKFKV